MGMDMYVVECEFVKDLSCIKMEGGMRYETEIFENEGKECFFFCEKLKVGSILMDT